MDPTLNELPDQDMATTDAPPADQAAAPKMYVPSGPTNMPTGLKTAPSTSPSSAGKLTLPKPNIKVEAGGISPALRYVMITLGVMVILMVIFIVIYSFLAQRDYTPSTTIINGSAPQAQSQGQP